MSEDEEIQSLINDLVALGALRPDNVDDEKVYYVNPERMKEVFPSFYEMFQQEVDETLVSLMNEGLVQVEYDENLNALFSLTEEGKKVADNIILSTRPFDF